jgi:hypothetical protein
MEFIKLRKILPILALGVLSLHVLGLLFCGEIYCLYSEGDEICQTLLCSLLDSHDQSRPLSDHSQNDPCQCTCYLSYDIPYISPIEISIVSSLLFSESQLFLSTSINRIDHIPKA